MEIGMGLILKIVLVGLVHWMLVPLALQSLTERRQVLGGRKALWAVAIVLFTCFGSLLYLVLHPQAHQTQTEVVSRTQKEPL